MVKYGTLMLFQGKHLRQMPTFPGLWEVYVYMREKHAFEMPQTSHLMGLTKTFRNWIFGNFPFLLSSFQGLAGSSDDQNKSEMHKITKCIKGRILQKLRNWWNYIMYFWIFEFVFIKHIGLILKWVIRPCIFFFSKKRKLAKGLTDTKVDLGNTVGIISAF